MGTDQLTELAQKIYQNHKGLFDFIYEHKPDIIDNLKQLFVEEVTNRGWILESTNKHNIRFCTNKIKDLIYINKINKSWTNGESFLFEIKIYPPDKKIKFQTVITPSDDNYDTSILSGLLSEIDGFKKALGKKWLVIILKTKNLIMTKFSL